MIIWSGHGILIPLLAFLGLVGGMSAAEFLEGKGWLQQRWELAVTAWGAALLVLIYAKTIGKTVERTYIDPSAEDGTVMYRKRHTFFFIPAFPWAVILVIAAALVTFLCFKNPEGFGSLRDRGNDSGPVAIGESGDSSNPFSAGSALPTAIRDWTAADGRPLRAALVRFTDASGDTAEFKRADGQVFTISLSKFSPESQEELRQLFESTKPGDTSGETP